MPTSHIDPKTYRTDISLGHLLKTCSALMHDAGAMTLSAHDLTLAQWLVLMKLAEGATSARELCRDMRYDNGAIVRLLDQLEARGFVKRRRSGNDRRMIDLALTQVGQDKIDEILPAIVGCFNQVLRDFSRTEYRELLRLVSKLMDGLKSYTGSAE